MIPRLIIAISCVFLLSACASINSSLVNNNSTGGLNYYLPKRDLIVTVTVSDPVLDKLKASKKAYTDQANFLKIQAQAESNPLEKSRLLKAAAKMDAEAGKLQIEITNHTEQPKITNTQAAMSKSYPDLSKQFSLNYNKSLLGINMIDVAISQNGLLNSSKSKTDNQFAEVLSSIASIAGSGSALKKRTANLRQDSEAESEIKCEQAGTYVFVMSLNERIENRPICGKGSGYSITLIVPGHQKDAMQPTINNSPGVENNTSYAGIFYRQNMPYQANIKKGNVTQEFLLFAPEPNVTHFLPIEKTTFADNEANFTFIDGVPTKYVQDSDGELVSLLAIPADVLAAYFTAIGSVFSSFADTDKAEISALNQSVLLELTKQKSTACLAAIEAGDSALIESLKCAE